MSDSAISKSLTGSRHGHSSSGARYPRQSVHIDGPNSSTKLAPQTKQPAQNATGHGVASFPELTGHLSANAEDARYGPRKFRNGIDDYRAAQEVGRKDAVGGFGDARSRAPAAFATPLQDVQSLRDPTLVNHNGATFGIVGTGGTVKKPTTSTRPRSRPAAPLSRSPAWGSVGEEGVMKPLTTTTKPKGGRIGGLR